MAQRLNKNLVIGLTITAMVATTICGAVLIIMLPPRKPEPLAEQAKQFADKGDFTQAAMAYMRAADRARRSPDHTLDDVNNYRILAGEMAQKGGKVNDALKFWEAVLNENPQHKSAHEHIVRLYLQMYRELGGLPESMWLKLQELGEKEQLKDTPLGLSAAGLAMIMQGGSVDRDRAEKGRALLEKACALNKSDAEPVSFLMEYHLGQAKRGILSARPDEAAQTIDDHFKAAEAAYDTLVANLPNDPAAASAAWRFRGTFYMQMRLMSWFRVQQCRQGKLPTTQEPAMVERMMDADRKAFESIERAIELAPKEDQVASATTRAALGDYWAGKATPEKDEAVVKANQKTFRENARKAYEEAVLLAPEEFDAYSKLASLYSAEGEPEKAAQVLEQRLSRAPVLGTYLELRNRIYMARFRETAFDIRYVQALPLKAEDPARATLIEQMVKLRDAYANEVAGGMENTVAQFMQARILVLQDREREAHKIIESAEKTSDTVENPQTRVNIKLMYAQLCVTTGTPTDAEAVLKALTEAEPALDRGWSLRAVVASRLGQPDLALQYAQRALQINGTNTQALTVLASVHESRGNIEEAAKIRKLLGREMSEIELALREALQPLKPQKPGEEIPQARIDEAKKLLRELLKSYPYQYQALHALVLVLHEEGNRQPELKEVNAKEIQKLVAAALAAVDEARRQAPTTAPAEGSKENLDAIASAIQRILVYTDPNASNEDVIAKAAQEIETQRKDPYERALALYNLYSRFNKNAEAMTHLKQALAARPEDADLLTNQFGLALKLKDWATATETLEKLTRQGKALVGGRFLRGQLLVEQANQAVLEDRKADAKSMATKAIEELSSGLLELPKTPDALVFKARAHAVLQDFSTAQSELNLALSMDPRHVQAWGALYHVAVIRGDEGRRLECLRNLQELAPDSMIVRAEAQALEDDRDPFAGIAAREKIAEQKPDDLDNLIALARLYGRTDQDQKARAAFEKCLAQAPENLVIVARYAEYLRSKKVPETEAATKLLQEAVQRTSSPNLKAAAQLMLAGHLEQMLRQRQPNAPTLQAVIGAYEAGAKIAETAECLVDIGQFYTRINQPKEAETRYRRAIELSNDNDELRELNCKARQSLIRILLAQEQRADESEREIAEYQKHFSGDGWGHLATSELELSRGRLLRAIAQVELFLEKNPRSAIGFANLATLQYQRGDLREAIAKLEQAVAIDRQSLNFEHRVLLAKCRADLGNTDLAINELQSVLSENREVVAAARQLADLYISLKQFPNAEAVVLPRARDARDQNRVLWLNLLVNIYAQMGRVDECADAARQAVELAGFRPPALMTYAEAVLKLNRPKDVIDLITTKAPAEFTQSVEVQSKLAEAYAKAGQTDQALEVYGRCADRIGENHRLWHALVASMIGALQREPTSEFFRKRSAADPAAWGNKFALALTANLSAEGAGDNAVLDSLLAETKGEDPAVKARRAVLLYEMSTLSHARKDYERARKQYEELLVIDPNNVMARNNFAFLLLIDLKDPQKAIEHSKAAAGALTPSLPIYQHSIVLDTLGWNLVLIGEHTSGIEKLREAISMGRAAGDSFAYTLAGLYAHLADGLLRRSQTSASASPDTDRSEAALAWNQARLLLRKSDTDPEETGKILSELAAKYQLKTEGGVATVPAAK